jgi:hypothetical protein
MDIRVLLRMVAILLAIAIVVSPAVGYIHFPPMTMQKMCEHSKVIRVLNVKKYDREKGIVIYEVAETLKGKSPRAMSQKHVIRPEAKGVKPIFDWLAEGKRAVMFTIEGGNMACGYVCIDELWYSIDYNKRDDYWVLLRVDPEMLACFHGSVELLEQVTRDILAGKEVDVPVKELPAPLTQADRDERAKAVNEVLIPNRK